MTDEQQARLLWTLAYCYEASVDAIQSLYLDAFDNNLPVQQLHQQLAELVEAELVYDLGDQEFELSFSGIIWLLEYEDKQSGNAISRLDRQFLSPEQIGPFAHVSKYLLTGRWYQHAPLVTPDSQMVFSDFCFSPFVWASLGCLSAARAEQVAFAGWFELCSRGEGQWVERILEWLQQLQLGMVLEVMDDSLLFDPQADDAFSNLALPYSPENIRGLFKGRRLKNMLTNLESLIDIAAVALYDDELAEQLVENYYQLVRGSGLVGGFVPGQLRYASMLVLTAEEYSHLFGEPAAWLERLVLDETAESVLWGELLLNLMMLFRWERLQPGTQQRFAQALAEHPLTDKLLRTTAENPLIERTLTALKQLLEPTAQHFFAQPSPWESWLDRVQRISNPLQPELGRERLIWLLNDDLDSLTVKLQKYGKKGWSKGRKLDIGDLHYRYQEVQTDQDRNIVMAASAISRWDYLSDGVPVNPSIAFALEKSERLFDSEGEPLTIYRSHPLVVLTEAEGCLRTSSFPELSEQPLSRNEFGAVLLNDMSDSSRRLLEAIHQFPAGISTEQLTQLHATLDSCDGLAWHCALSGQGNIQLLEWNSQPELCLSWRELQLEIALICQPLDLSANHYQQPAAQGAEWVYNSQRQRWYRRDLDSEREAARQLVKQLPLRLNKKLRWQLPFDEALDFIEQLAEQSELPVTWQGDTKLRLLSHNQLSLDVQRKQQWFSVSGVSKVDKDLELELRTLLAGSKQRLLRLENGDTLVLSQSLRRQLQLLDSVLNEELEVDQRLAYPLAQLFEGMQHSGDAAWQSLVERWREKPLLDTDSLAPLRDYQQTSVRWAAHLSHHQFGACLADDMGLGKTLQALTLLAHYAPQGPALVVMPKSVLHNWQSEAQRFTPQLELIDLEACEDRARSIANAKPNQLLLISYGLLPRQSEALAGVAWQSVVLDEAQNIKNPTTKRAKAVFALQARVRLALTGTPIENHLIELWSLFNFINPGLLGGRTAFLRNYGNASDNADDLARLRALVSPFIMRRTKGEVLTELPAKTEITHSIELSAKQRTAYEAVRKQVMSDVKAGKGLVEVLSAMTRLRQVCCDPRLVFEHINEPGGKLNEALALIGEALENGHRILVFSQFVRLLKNLAELLDGQAIQYSYLDGQSSSSKRKQAIEQFKQGDTELFLISLKAGGTGLNLTEADMVIHLDPWWNPAVEDQASDRAHRMGQTKPVTVYRLVAEDSIEEKIVALHEEKRELADKILSGQSEGQTLNPEMLLGLLTD